MNSKTIPAELPLDTEGACALSLECWRLRLIAELLRDSNEGAGVRHAVRRITETLKGMGIEVVDFSGGLTIPGWFLKLSKFEKTKGYRMGTQSLTRLLHRQ